ncbi:dipeptidase [Gordonia sp. NB41Y]|uniref:dipeptidase n=1 Tax=Gordonia sp. NB41Y TaxID=875808 RepID=UPI0002BD5D6B|nr:dipeptidase [Gordonia sp. NB41Y]EMP14475.1 beta-Ala-His dipeptidase [Gordonia sp. NB41Y]WLP92573.1 dipeptidase [Gordonia sp. NB41Y]
MTDDTLRDRVHAQMPRARTDLTEMVSFRSVHDAAQSPPEECDKMVDWLQESFSAIGFDDVAAHTTSDGSKAVVGHLAGPDDAPTVLLYFHHDVQPPLGDDQWDSPVWTLTERDGRWYGRGAADCKGNIAMHLAALRALGGERGVNITIVGEGSEEQGTGGLEDFVPKHADLLAADAILVCDSGNFAVGRPALTTSLRGIANVVVTVETLSSAMHSGMFGGAAPDALAALVAMLATLRDEHGNTTIAGLDASAHWDGVEYPVDAFRTDATVLDGVDLLGSGSVADMVWARPAATVLGIDCPPVVGSSAAIQPRARARINLRVPPGMDAQVAQQALIHHLQRAAPWHVRVTIDREADGAPFIGATAGVGYDTMVDAMRRAYGTEVLLMGQGGSIPLCNVFAETFPDAEIMLLGVEEPQCLIHAPNESVDPSEIEHMALVEALFLQSYATARDS